MGYVCGGCGDGRQGCQVRQGQIMESSVYHVGNLVMFTHRILGKRRVCLGFVFKKIIPNVETREAPHETVGKWWLAQKKNGIVSE